MPTPNYDAWKTSPPEPDVVGKCAHCEADLYIGCEYAHDRNENEWYCGDTCYVDAKRESGDLVTEVVDDGT
jgi:hypothetical protein